MIFAIAMLIFAFYMIDMASTRVKKFQVFNMNMYKFAFLIFLNQTCRDKVNPSNIWRTVLT